MEQALLVYLLLVNAAGFFLMLADKQKARKNQWRIPERTLLGVAAIGGSLGSLVGMYLFRHKTRHLKFTVSIPLLLLLHLALLFWLWQAGGSAFNFFS